jgi:AmmeMemoRadiSam system protein B
MPALRQHQALPMKKDNQPLIALRDPYMLSKETVVIPANVYSVIQQIDGNTTSEEIVKTTKVPAEKFIELLEKLDGVGLLWGPTSKKLEENAIKQLKADDTFPIRSSRSLGETHDDCREKIEKWFAETEDPEFDKPVKAVVAPHLDYERGWQNYAAAYYAWKDTDTPDRVVIFGTNHFGNGDGVVLSTIGFSTPMGTCPVDKPIIGALEKQFGRNITIDLIDHIAEHSIELQLPWLQYNYGNVPVVAALIPNPLDEMIEDDGERTTIDEFIPALRAILDEVGGTTLFVASADLSHVGQQFGEPRPVDEQRRFDVERHDREMMTKFISNDAEEFISAMRWNNNATQWCSIGNMSAVLKLVCPDEIELIDYRQSCDDKGAVLVSSCAMALL